MVVVSVPELDSNRVNILNSWREIGRTEIIKDNLNPKFIKSFMMNYYFEETQPIRFAVYDIDEDSSSRLQDQDFIGEAIVNLGEIVGARGQSVAKPLQNSHAPSRKNGLIKIFAEEVRSINDLAFFDFKARLSASPL